MLSLFMALFTYTQPQTVLTAGEMYYEEPDVEGPGEEAPAAASAEKREGKR